MDGTPLIDGQVPLPFHKNLVMDGYGWFMDGLWMTWGWFMDVDWVYHMSWLPLNIIEHPKSDVELGWLDTYEG